MRSRWIVAPDNRALPPAQTASPANLPPTVKCHALAADTSVETGGVRVPRQNAPDHITARWGANMRAWYTTFSLNISDFRPSRTWPLLVLIVLCAVGTLHGPRMVRGEPIDPVSEAPAPKPDPVASNRALPRAPGAISLLAAPHSVDEFEPPRLLRLNDPLAELLLHPIVGQPKRDELTSITPVDPVLPAPVPTPAPLLLDLPSIPPTGAPGGGAGSGAPPAEGDTGAPPQLLGSIPPVTVVSSDPPADGGAIPENSVIVAGPGALTPIPEPTGLALIGACVLSLRRKRR